MHHHEECLFEWIGNRRRSSQDLVEALLYELRHLKRMEDGTLDANGDVTQPASRSGISQEVVGEESVPELGWGTWIRTKAARVRAGSSTAKLSPTGTGRASYHASCRRSTSPRGGGPSHRPEQCARSPAGT